MVLGVISGMRVLAWAMVLLAPWTKGKTGKAAVRVYDVAGHLRHLESKVN